MTKQTQNLVKKIVCFAVMVIIMVALIVGDVIAWQYALNIDGFLGVNQTDFSNASAELQASDRLCTEIEEDSITLLKNESVGGKPALPLDSSVTKLNVFGFGSTDQGFLVRGIGSGSSTISDAKKITLLDALQGKARDYDVQDLEGVTKEDWASTHLVGYEVNPDIIALSDSQKTRPSNYGLWEPDQTALEGVIDSAKAFSNVAIFTVSRNGGENIGEIPDTYNELSDAEKKALTTIRANFDKVIVILNTANTMHLGWLDDYCDACINVGLTGQSGARAIPEILAGKKFVDTYDEDGNITGVDEVKFSPSGRFTDIITQSKEIVSKYDPTWVNRAPTSNSITYADDIYYGYKWYETAEEENFFDINYNEIVKYPFGHGLSYTTFSKKITNVTYGDNKKLNDNANIDSLTELDEITVSIEVENTGSYAGSEVVQLYYTPEYYAGGIEKAYVNLLDFGKTGLLQPGGKETVTVSFTLFDMASYDCYDKNGNQFWGYELEHGKYELKLMDNSHDEIEKHTLVRNEDLKITKDPATGTEIVNQFTGKDSSWSDDYNGSSYAGLGTDGYETGVAGYSDRNIWLSRADFEGTFPKTKAAALTSSNAAVKKANEWLVDDELGAVLEEPVASPVDSGLRLVRIAEYADDIVDLQPGAEPLEVRIATLDELNGNLKSNERFEYDWKLIEELAAEYDSDKWNDLLDQMSVAEMKKLIELGGFRRLSIESVGKPHQNDCDGPAGFNTASITGNWEGGSADTMSWTAYTSEALIGCCWNKGLMLAMGLSMGAEASVTNVGGWYAPGVNLHRSNYTARNYEYYSEDGVLSGKLAAYVIAGAKINNLNCYLKHFVCSEEGPNPGNVNTWLTEQNLRENYLKPFEIAVKEGGANSLMTAFNNVGSSWAGANYAMNIKVLRDEWGFKGTLITDWSGGGVLGGMYSRQGVRAGNDLWLNNGTTLSNPLDATKDAKYIRNSAHNILYTFVDTINEYHQYQSGNVELEPDSELSVLLAKYGMGELNLGGSGQEYSWWKAVLIVIDVLVALGFVVWALFLTGVAQKLIAKVKNTPATEEVSSDAADENVTQSEDNP